MNARYRRVGGVSGVAVAKARWFENVAEQVFGTAANSRARALHTGHINASALVSDGDTKLVVQIINSSVFGDPSAVMANALAATEAMRRSGLPTIEFVPTQDGAAFATVDQTAVRAYRWIEGDATPAIRTPDDAQANARAFGRYVTAIEGLDLTEHLPGYHDFDARVRALESAIDADECGRFASSGDTAGLVLAVVDRLRLTSAYAAYVETPTRNVHNDAKGPNSIVGPHGSRTVIDLDTTMPGRMLADIGELVRSSTRHLDRPSEEDLMAIIEAVNRGFLAGCRVELADTERRAMLLAGPLLAAENAARFLTDHLQGDKYYGADAPEQNLDRAVAQIRLAERLISAIEWATSSI